MGGAVFPQFNDHLITGAQIADQKRRGLIRLEEKQLTEGISKSRSVSVTDFCLWMGGKSTHIRQDRAFLLFISLTKSGEKNETTCFHMDKATYVLSFTQGGRNLLDYFLHLSALVLGGYSRGFDHCLASVQSSPKTCLSPPGRRAAHATVQ